MEKDNRTVFFQWLIPFVILFNTWSFLGGWVTLFARTWLWLLVGIIALIVVEPKFFTTKIFYSLLCYSIIVVLNRLSGDEYYRSWSYVFADIFSLVFYPGVCYYIIHRCPEKISRAIMFSSFFVIVFTSIATYFAVSVYPNIVRIMVANANNGISNTPFYRIGVCDYSMPHALPILIAPLFLWLKSEKVNKISKLLILGLLFFILLLVWTSGATTPLLVAIFAIVVSLLVSQNKSFKANVRMLIVVTVLVLPLTSDNVQLETIHYLEKIVPDSNANYGKLKYFEDSILYGSEGAGDITARKNRYEASIDAVLHNFIIGTNNKDEIGGHSIILDRFAILGIGGIVFFLLIFYFTFREIYYNTIQNKRVFFLIGVICFMAIILLKNITGSWMHPAVFLLLPIMVNYKREKLHVE